MAPLDFMPIKGPERMRFIIFKLPLCRMTGLRERMQETEPGNILQEAVRRKRVRIKQCLLKKAEVVRATFCSIHDCPH